MVLLTYCLMDSELQHTSIRDGETRNFRTFL